MQRFLCIFLALIGCAGLQKSYDKPRITLANISIRETVALETAFLIELRVFNTNDTPLNVLGLDCDLEINGKHFATGVTRADTTIPAYGTEIVAVMVYSSVLDTVNRFIDMVRNVQKNKKIEDLEYSLRGRLRVQDGTTSTSSIPFETKGRLNLEGISGMKSK